MIVANRKRETAIVIRRDGRKVALVVMRGGSLSALKLTEQSFRVEWQEMDYPLDQALERFLQHVSQHGATQEARKGLQALHERDRPVVASLF